MTFRDVFEKYWCPISPDIKPPQKDNGLVNIFDNLLTGWRYYFITLALLSLSLLSSFRIYFVSFGLLLIVSLSIHWLWGWAELPFLGSNLPMVAGSFVVNSLTTRFIYLLAGLSGVDLLAWSGVGWYENSEINAAIASEWLSISPLTCIAIILVSLCFAFIVGGFAGWLIVRPGLGRGKVFVAIISYVLVDAGFAFLTGLGGGYDVVFIPDLFVFAGENGLLALSFIVLAVVFIGLYGYNQLRGSRFGLDVKSKADVSVLGRAVFLGCGLIGVAGCLLSIYHEYMYQGNFLGIMWGYWPLLVFLIAGSRGGSRLFLGVFVLMALQYLIRESQVFLRSYLFFPVAYMFQLETGLVILLSCFYYLKKVQTQKNDSFREAG